MSQVRDPFQPRAAEEPSPPDDLAWTLNSTDSFVREFASYLARFLDGATLLEGPMFVRLRPHEGRLRVSLGLGSDKSAGEDFKVTI